MEPNKEQDEQEARDLTGDGEPLRALDSYSYWKRNVWLVFIWTVLQDLWVEPSLKERTEKGSMLGIFLTLVLNNL